MAAWARWDEAKAALDQCYCIFSRMWRSGASRTPRIPCPSPTPVSAEEVAAQLMNSPTPEYKSHLGSFLPPGSEGFGNHYVELSSSKRSLSDVSGELD